MAKSNQVNQFLLLLVLAICTLSIAYAEQPDKLVINTKFDQSQSLLAGQITDKQGVSVPNVTIKITTEKGTYNTTSDQNGKFKFALDFIPTSNKFNVGIQAEKDGYLTTQLNTVFFISGKPADKIGSSYKVLTADEINQDPVALKILQNIEESKKQEESRQRKLQEIAEKQKFLEEQRKAAQQDLLLDLGAWFSLFDPFNPRNAFATFVSQMDSAVQTIYWAQFNFTEAKTKEGLAALQAVLDSGGTPQQARKAFYEKAATPRDELIKANEEFNSKYSQTNQTKSKP